MQAAVEQVKTELSCTFLELDWDDSQQFDIPDDDLVKCVQFVHAAISKGHSVLVHCAQVSIIILCCNHISVVYKAKQSVFVGQTTLLFATLPRNHSSIVHVCQHVIFIALFLVLRGSHARPSQ